MEEKKITSPIKAIRAYCLGCVGGSSNEVKLCPCTQCELHPFRFGKNPYSNRKPLTEEQKKARAENLQKARQAQN